MTFFVEEDTSCYDRLLTMWNKHIAPMGYPKPRRMTQDRIQNIKELSKYYNTKDIITLRKMLRDSTYLHNKPWCTIDWVAEDNHLSLILEGKYVDRMYNGGYKGGSMVKANRI